MDDSAPLRVTLLDGFVLWRGDRAVPVAGARSRGLVVRLALAGGRRVELAALVDAIWADDPPGDTAHALQALVSRLRRTLGPTALPQVEGGYRLVVAAADVDALRFTDLAATGRARLRGGDPGGAAAVLREAVARWGGLPGAEPAVVAAVAPAAATRLAQVSVDAVTDLAESHLSLGQADAAAAGLSTLLNAQPVHERAAALLMDALAAQGRQADALAWYERIRHTLAERLGADPGAALRERHLRLLRDDEQPPTVDTEPETPLTHLPTPVTSFVGRDDDLARVNALLAAGRLVTVLGPGGAGKTRLALEAAHRRGPLHRDGATMVTLASVHEPAELAAAVLATTRHRGGALLEGRKPRAGTELDAIADQLAGRECLLMIDSCEHLIDSVATLVAALLPRCPRLRVLATSREPLAIDGEALVPLGPLSTPGPGDDVETARRTASVRLFTDRAAAVRPGFTVDQTTLPAIRQVVVGLDGLPLALELAAARLRTLSLPELVDGLSDRFRLLATGSRAVPPRHRTLGGVIAWSWDLLSEPERILAERLAVLPGGVTADAARVLCTGTAVPPGDVPELLAALVDRSLLALAPEPGRYLMLQTIREYGTIRLIATGDLGAARDLAARHIATLLTRHEPQLRGSDQVSAMRIIGADYDNALAALRLRCEAHNADDALALALLLTWYWQMSGRSADAAYWLGEALAVPGGTPTPDRACAEAIRVRNRAETHKMTADAALCDTAEMRAAADRLLALPDLPSPYGVFCPILLTYLDDHTAALPIFDRLVAGTDAWQAGVAHMFRAQIALNNARLDAVHTDVAAALARFAELGDRCGRAAVLPIRSALRQYDGDLDGALADLHETRSLSEEFGLFGLTDHILADLHRADLLLRHGDTEHAINLIDAARERARRANAAQMLCLINAREAEFRTRLGDLDRARELLDNTGHTADDIADSHVYTLISTAQATVHLCTGDIARAHQALATAHTMAKATYDLPTLALVATGVAALAQTHQQHHELAVLLGVTARLRGAHDDSDPQLGELTRHARNALGDAAFTAAYTAGRELDSQQAIAHTNPTRLHTAHTPPTATRPARHRPD